MTEKRTRKIEKHIARGVVRYMLLKGFQSAAFTALLLLVVRLINSLGILNLVQSILSDTVAIIASMFVLGCLSSFTYWDRMLELHKQNVYQGQNVETAASPREL